MLVRPHDTLIIFSDGACTGNPGPGGWASVIITPDDQVTELGGSAPSTTNNRMEMLATIKALEFAKDLDWPIWLYTDSTYVIRGITQWIWGWQKKQWVGSNGAEVANKDLWLMLRDVTRARPKEFPIEWRYVRGHTGVAGNERCDEIAVAFTKGKRPKLFSGSLADYDLDMSAVPAPEELPEMKSIVPGEKKVAYSYLSFVNGVLNRHATWPECERAVKGRPGAKFKKAMSAEDELKIVKEWGLDPARLAKV